MQFRKVGGGQDLEAWGLIDALRGMKAVYVGGWAGLGDMNRSEMCRKLTDPTSGWGLGPFLCLRCHEMGGGNNGGFAAKRDRLRETAAGGAPRTWD